MITIEYFLVQCQLSYLVVLNTGKYDTQYIVSFVQIQLKVLQYMTVNSVNVVLWELMGV